MAYVVLGWIVASYEVLSIGNLLSLFLILGIIVWALVIRRSSVKYFIRYHIVQALLLNISLSAALWLLIAVLGLLGTLPLLNLLASVSYTALFDFHPMSILPYFSEASIKDIFVMSIALVMGFYCVRGRYTELPWITDGVRHWL